MFSWHSKEPGAELSVRLKYLMFQRVILVTLLLGVSLFIETRDARACFGQIQTFHYLLIALSYLLTILYVIAFKYTNHISLLAYVQLVVDTLLVTAIIYATGGIESLFSFVYPLVIIAAGIMLYQKGALIIASSSTLFYGLLLLFYYLGFIHPLGEVADISRYRNGLQLIYIFSVNMAGFFLVALLSSYLSSQAKKAHLALKAKQSDFDNLEVLQKSIINGVPSGVIAVDDTNRIVLFNPASENMLGVKAETVSDEHITFLFPSLFENLPISRNSDSLSIKKSFADFVYTRPDTQKRYLRVSSAPLILPGGRRTGQIFVIQDMTEIRLSEQELKKVEGLAMTGELAARVAHEIRNPLASISGSVQMLKEGMKKDDINIRLMDIVVREIKRLNHLVDDFLVFARSGKKFMQSFELNSLLRESLSIFQGSQHMNRDIDIKTDFKEDIVLNSDPDGLKQVLWNIFLNACDAMPDGGTLYVTSFTELQEHPSSTKMAWIVVRDTGKGFKQENLSQVFSPFFTTKERGTGLGLAIVKGIIDGLGGDIFADNHKDGGAVIKIMLPLTPVS